MSSPSEVDLLLFAASGTISPLPAEAKLGVIASGICGLLSFLSCGTLFLYISYRLLRSRTSRSKDAHGLDMQVENISSQAFDVVGAAGPNTANKLRKTLTAATLESETLDSEGRSRNKRPSHSFLTLIHHLLMADMLQACAFLVSVHWWRMDGIYVPTFACGARKNHPPSILPVASSRSARAHEIRLPSKTKFNALQRRSLSCSAAFRSVSSSSPSPSTLS